MTVRGQGGSNRARAATQAQTRRVPPRSDSPVAQRTEQQGREEIHAGPGEERSAASAVTDTSTGEE